MSDGFDLHDHRHQLKQLRDSGDTKLFKNREELDCPACGRPFTKLFVSEKQATRFPENDGARFCLYRAADSVLVFRH